MVASAFSMTNKAPELVLTFQFRKDRILCCAAKKFSSWKISGSFPAKSIHKFSVPVWEPQPLKAKQSPVCVSPHSRLSLPVAKVRQFYFVNGSQSLHNHSIFPLYFVHSICSYQESDGRIKFTICYNLQRCRVGAHSSAYLRTTTVKCT